MPTTLDNQGLPVLLCSDWLYLKMLQPFLLHPTLWFAFTALVAMCFSKCRRSVILSLRLQDSLAAKLYTYLLQNVNKESVIYLYLRAKEYSIISCRFMCCIHHAGLFIKLLRRWLCTHCNYKSIIHHFF